MMPGQALCGTQTRTLGTRTVAATLNVGPERKMGSSMSLWRRSNLLLLKHCAKPLWASGVSLCSHRTCTMTDTA